MYKFYLLITLLLCCYSVNASLPLQQELKLVGESKLSVLFWDVYKIKLFTKDGQYINKQIPIIVELLYQREITSEALIEETAKQWKRFNLNKEKIEIWLKQLKTIWPNVNESDTIAFHIDNQNYTSFYFNDRFIGKVEDEAFSKYFSLIWLDTNGPYPKMTKQLLGKK